MHTIIDWRLPINTGFEFQGSTQTSKHSLTCTRKHTVRMPAFPFPPIYLKPVPLLLSLLLWLYSRSSSPFPPKASSKEDTHHFITLMNLVGFSRRGWPPVMQRQIPPVPRQLLLMFKVMQRDRLIKRRLGEALGPSLSHHEGLVTVGSRVLQPRQNGPPRAPCPHTHTRASSSLPLLSPCHRSSTGFTMVQVFTETRLSHGLIKPDIYSGTVSKWHRGERDQKGWGCWPSLSLSYWMIQIHCAP